MRVRKIAIATDFTRHPGGRYKRDGAFSGEEFREDILWPAVQDARSSGDRIEILLDGTDGYAASFLEEAFGGLVRVHRISPNVIMRVVKLTTDDPHYRVYKNLAEQYIKDAGEAIGLSN